MGMDGKQTFSDRFHVNKLILIDYPLSPAEFVIVAEFNEDAGDGIPTYRRMLKEALDKFDETFEVHSDKTLEDSFGLDADSCTVLKEIEVAGENIEDVHSMITASGLTAGL